MLGKCLIVGMAYWHIYKSCGNVEPFNKTPPFLYPRYPYPLSEESLETNSNRIYVT